MNFPIFHSNFDFRLRLVLYLFQESAWHQIFCLFWFKYKASWIAIEQSLFSPHPVDDNSPGLLSLFCQKLFWQKRGSNPGWENKLCSIAFEKNFSRNTSKALKNKKRDYGLRLLSFCCRSFLFILVLFVYRYSGLSGIWLMDWKPFITQNYFFYAASHAM